MVQGIVLIQGLILVNVHVLGFGRIEGCAPFQIFKRVYMSSLWERGVDLYDLHGRGVWIYMISTGEGCGETPAHGRAVSPP